MDKLKVSSQKGWFGLFNKKPTEKTTNVNAVEAREKWNNEKQFEKNIFHDVSGDELRKEQTPFLQLGGKWVQNEKKLDTLYTAQNILIGKHRTSIAPATPPPQDSPRPGKIR